MALRNFDELIRKVQNLESVKRVAVVAAQDEHTLEAVFRARKENIVEPLLIGEAGKIKELLRSMRESLDDSSIIDAENDASAAEIAVAMVHEKKADFIMKGGIQTADLLKAVVNREKGLRTGRVMGQIVLHEMPSYHKLLAVTDGGMMLCPTLGEKKQLLESSVDTLIAMGCEEPKVAVLAAVEKVNPKMQDSVDAALLKEMNVNGEIKNCVVEGPISYDLIMSRESARIKGYESPVSGDADIIIVPNITVGNVLGKAYVYNAGAKMAGFVFGAKVPIVLTSRASSAEEKYLSLVLSASAAKAPG